MRIRPDSDINYAYWAENTARLVSYSEYKRLTSLEPFKSRERKRQLERSIEREIARRQGL